MSVWRNRPLMVTIITVIILIVLLIMTAGTNNMSGTESIVGSILSPVQSGLYSVADAISDFFSRIFSGADLQSENADLKAKVAELEGKLQDYNEVKKENERLADLLNFNTTTEDFEYQAARVIGKAYGHWFNVFVINRGLSSGIEVDMPVMNGDGLIGRVVAVGANWSRVITIVDSMSGVSAIVERTRDHGMASGTISTGDEGEALLIMGFLPLDADLVPGDRVITSGLAGEFPKGIPIGEVTEVSTSSNGMKNVATITPWVDFNHLEEVLVIMTKPLAAEALE